MCVLSSNGSNELKLSLIFVGQLNSKNINAILVASSLKGPVIIVCGKNRFQFIPKIYKNVSSLSFSVLFTLLPQGYNLHLAVCYRAISLILAEFH